MKRLLLTCALVVGGVALTGCGEEANPGPLGGAGVMQGVPLVAGQSAPSAGTQAQPIVSEPIPIDMPTAGVAGMLSAGMPAAGVPAAGVGAGAGAGAGLPQGMAGQTAGVSPEPNPMAGTGGGAPVEPQWELLIEGDWQLPQGVEGYQCVRKTLTEDLYIAGFRAQAPPGTHHTVLGVSTSGGADGQSDCNAATLGTKMLFGSGVGTDTYELPEGVALHVRAGEQLLLNLHLFNAGDQAITGSSGTLIRTVDVDDVVHVADNILAGPMSLSIPPGNVTQSGRCTMSHDVTLISVFPHMHQLGIHMTATAHSSIAGDVVLHDGPYDFDRQTIHPIEAIELRAGDTIDIECRYDNYTDSTVRFGDSSLAEMCFLGLFRYPAATSSRSIFCPR